MFLVQNIGTPTIVFSGTKEFDINQSFHEKKNISTPRYLEYLDT